MFTDRFGAPKARPEVAIERDSRVVAMRAFRELALEGDMYGVVRMPRVDGTLS